MPEQLTNYDFEEERLDIKNFVIYYFEYRIKLDGEEWYESPGIVDDLQEEHIMMSKLASIFEQKRRAEISKMVEEILEDSSLAFPRFCDVLDEFDREGNDNSKRMSYARLVGIIAFSGCLAAALIRNNQRREVQQVLLYTSTFLGTRIRLTWSSDDRSWAQFMTFSKDLIRRDEKKKSEARRQSRRSFKIMVGVGIGVAVLGSVVGAKLLR